MNETVSSRVTQRKDSIWAHRIAHFRGQVRDSSLKGTHQLFLRKWIQTNGTARMHSNAKCDATRDRAAVARVLPLVLKLRPKASPRVLSVNVRVGNSPYIMESDRRELQRGKSEAFDHGSDSRLPRSTPLHSCFRIDLLTVSVVNPRSQVFDFSPRGFPLKKGDGRDSVPTCAPSNGAR